MDYEDFVKIGLVPSIQNQDLSVSTMQIATSLLAFAAGDAIGVEYEIQSPKKVVQIDRMGTRPDWPFGGVSDDTLLTLITIKTFAESDISNARENFLVNLKAAVPNLRGLGPTTRAALGIPMEPHLMAMVGNTNGGLMRTSLIGLAYPASKSLERRRMVHELASSTHKNVIAAYSAVLASALFSESLEERPRSDFEVLKAEVEQIDDLPEEFQEFVDGYHDWVPPQDGITLESMETLRAVTWVVENARNTLDAYRLSCELGGDTDTVAAQAGALICAKGKIADDFFSIPWLHEVLWNEVVDLRFACETLVNRRFK